MWLEALFASFDTLDRYGMSAVSNNLVQFINEHAVIPACSSQASYLLHQPSSVKRSHGENFAWWKRPSPGLTQVFSFALDIYDKPRFTFQRAWLLGMRNSAWLILPTTSCLPNLTPRGKERKLAWQGAWHDTTMLRMWMCPRGMCPRGMEPQPNCLWTSQPGPGKGRGGLLSMKFHAVGDSSPPIPC